MSRLEVTIKDQKKTVQEFPTVYLDFTQTCHCANGIVITLPQALSNDYCLMGDNGRLQHLRFCLFETYVSVVFVIRCLYSGVSLTLV